MLQDTGRRQCKNVLGFSLLGDDSNRNEDKPERTDYFKNVHNAKNDVSRAFVIRKNSRV